MIEDAPGSSADMSIGLMVHERLEYCLGLHPELSRLDSTRSGFEGWKGSGVNSRETRESAARLAEEPRRRDEKETIGRRGCTFGAGQRKGEAGS